MVILRLIKSQLSLQKNQFGDYYGCRRSYLASTHSGEFHPDEDSVEVIVLLFMSCLSVLEDVNQNACRICYL